MKAQFEVSEEVWGRVKVASMLACKSIGEMIEPVLSEAFPKSGPVDLKVGKVVLGGASESPVKTSKPAKEGSKAMSEALDKVAPVKSTALGGQPLQEKVCVSCGKPMGDDPHFTCKKCRGDK